jgi:hypothetical protein
MVPLEGIGSAISSKGFGDAEAYTIVRPYRAAFRPDAPQRMTALVRKGNTIGSPTPPRLANDVHLCEEQCVCAPHFDRDAFIFGALECI